MTRSKSLLILTAAMGVCLILLFQNCGTGEYGLYGSRQPQPLDCLDDLACEQNPENLWLESYGEYAAFRYRTQDIAGDCNAGGFPDNRILYKLYRISGATEILIANGTAKCDELGRYRVRVDLGSNPNYSYPYFVAMKIEGIDAQGNFSENLRYPNSAEVEVPLKFLN